MRLLHDASRRRVFQIKIIIPDWWYTFGHDMWSVDEVVVIDISRYVTFKDKKTLFLTNLISKNA